jgi:hypothetical protein
VRITAARQVNLNASFSVIPVPSIDCGKAAAWRKTLP